MTTRRGTIDHIEGHPMSGLWLLVFTDGRSAHIESGYGVRQLAACFDAHEGSGDLMEKIKGQEIAYTTDEFGVMEAFTPIEDFALELEPDRDYTDEELMEMIEG